MAAPPRSPEARRERRGSFLGSGATEGAREATPPHPRGGLKAEGVEAAALQVGTHLPGPAAPSGCRSSNPHPSSGRATGSWFGTGRLLLLLLGGSWLSRCPRGRGRRQAGKGAAAAAAHKAGPKNPARLSGVRDAPGGTRERRLNGLSHV